MSQVKTCGSPTALGQPPCLPNPLDHPNSNSLLYPLTLLPLLGFQLGRHAAPLSISAFLKKPNALKKYLPVLLENLCDEEMDLVNRVQVEPASSSAVTFAYLRLLLLQMFPHVKVLGLQLLRVWLRFLLLLSIL